MPEEVLAPYLRRVLAPNPGPMTLDGTNTWIVGDPEQGPPVVIDPGPDDEEHLRRVLAVAGGRIAAIVLTHQHADHSAGAPRLAHLAGCGVRAADPGLQLGPDLLTDRVELRVPAARLVPYATPGHTSDSFSVVLVGDDGVARMATGDTVLGRGTTVITHPDGHLGSYLASLDVLAELTRTYQVVEILPGHGPLVRDPGDRLAGYRSHRLERLQQVRDAVVAGDVTPAAIVARVYADVDRAVWPAAEQSVAAQLEYLNEDRRG